MDIDGETLPVAVDRPVIFVFGCTASGKTRLAIELAQALNGEIVSADSMQVYRGADIGTAKASAVEQAQAPHHMLDCCELTDTLNAGVFVQRAVPIIDDIQRRGRTPIIAGGTIQVCTGVNLMLVV